MRYTTDPTTMLREKYLAKIFSFPAFWFSFVCRNSVLATSLLLYLGAELERYLQVYVSQNTTVRQNTSFFISLIKN